MAYGGPERLEDVEAYYTDIRHGAPPPPELLGELVARYRAIGGGSPLPRIVERQRAALADELARRGREMPVRVGMRHTEPRIARAVEALAGDGLERIVGLALAPQRSPSIVGYAQAATAALERLGAGAPRLTMVESWHEEPRLVEALAAATRDALASAAGAARPWVLFTAHSLPERLGQEAEAYRSEVERTAALVAARAGVGRWSVALQSAGRTGESWLGPELRSEIRRLAGEGTDVVVVCPVGFVSDHLEVLYDIDIDARAVAHGAGARLVRARSMNDDPVFVAALADVVERALDPIPNGGDA